MITVFSRFGLPSKPGYVVYLKLGAKIFHRINDHSTIRADFPHHETHLAHGDGDTAARVRLLGPKLISLQFPIASFIVHGNPSRHLADAAHDDADR